MKTMTNVSSPVYVPLLYLERFADWAGISKNVLREKVDQRSIPIVDIEHRKMVDISQLNRWLPDYENCGEALD